jgi:SulP family sulfate permease
MIFKRSLQNQFQIATALRETFSKGYSARTFKDDIVAAFIIAMVSLPLSIALSVAVGLPPANGLYTAIVAGLIVPLLGGSQTQITGPTAAFVVIVAPIVADLGMRGVIWCQIIAGMFLILMGISRVGKYIQYIPYSVTTGFSAGIALVVAVYALDNFFGIKIRHLDTDLITHVTGLFENISKINFYELAVGGLTLAIIVIFTKFHKLIPSSVLGITAGAGLAFILNKYGHNVSTIESMFTYVDADRVIQKGIKGELPTFNLPSLRTGDIYALPSLSELKIFLMPALVIAMLAALESLLSATVADSMTGTKHNSSSELNALGVGNIFTGFALGMPATGAIARTAANINAGGKTPISAIFNAIFILVFLLFCTPLIKKIPMAALSALLLINAYRLSQFRQFLRIIAEAPKSDVAVLLICFFLTAFVDIVAGITVGMILASLLFMKSVSEITNVKLESKRADTDEQNNSLPDDVLVYNIDGPLFFGSVQKAYTRSNFMNDKIKTIIINMEHVPYIDISGLMAIKGMVNTTTRQKRRTILVGNNKIISMILRKTSFGSNVDDTQYIETYESFSEVVKGFQEQGQ